MSAGIIGGMTWGVCHAKVYDSPRIALNIGGFIFSGCLDAPDDMPAGSTRYVEFGPGEDEWGIEMVMFPRECHAQRKTNQETER